MAGSSGVNLGVYNTQFDFVQNNSANLKSWTFILQQDSKHSACGTKAFISEKNSSLLDSPCFRP